jgi:NADP-dependent 3-hydroxy acid dehydrogenase YdfG
VAETERLIKSEFPNVKILAVIIDVTDEKSVNAMVDQAVNQFRTLDYGETTPRMSGICRNTKS